MAKKQDDVVWYKDSFVWIVALIVVILLMVIGAQHQQPKAVVKTEKKEAVTTSRWNGAAYYDQIQTGMTRTQVEQIIQKGPQSCTTSETPGVGTMEMCTYGNPLLEEVTLNITYLNGVVYNKTKVDF